MSQHKLDYDSYRKIHVERRNAFDKYYAALDSPKGFGYVAHGPCGSGKSTYAVAGLTRRSWISRVFLVVPTDAIRDQVVSTINQISGTRSGILRVFTYEQFVSVVAAACDYENAVIILDEVHLRTPECVAIRFIVDRSNRDRIFVTATPDNDSSVEAISGIGASLMYSPSASLRFLASRVALDGTIWDPKMWKGRSRMITYPVTEENRRRLVRYYKSKGTVVAVAEDGKPFSIPNGFRYVILSMGQNDVGMTVDADLLIDTGYIADYEYRDMSVKKIVRPMTLTETAQRRSRVGRRSVDSLIIASGENKVSDKVGDAYLLDGYVIAASAGLAHEYRCEFNIDAIDVPRDVAIDCVETRINRYYGAALSKMIGDQSRVQWDDVFSREPDTLPVGSVSDTVKSAYAQVYGDRWLSHYARARCSIRWCAVRNGMRVSVVRHGKRYYVKRRTAGFKTGDHRDIVVETNLVSTNVQRLPGPRTLASRLFRYASVLNMSVVVVLNDVLPMGACRSYEELDRTIKNRQGQEGGETLVGFTLYCFVRPTSDSRTNITVNDTTVTVDIRGFVVVRGIDASVFDNMTSMWYRNYNGEMVTREVPVAEVALPIDTPRSEIIGTRDRPNIDTFGSRLNKWGSRSRYPIVLSVNAGVPSDVCESWSELHAMSQHTRSLDVTPRVLRVFCAMVRVERSDSVDCILLSDDGMYLLTPKAAEIVDASILKYSHVEKVQWTRGTGSVVNTVVFVEDHSENDFMKVDSLVGEEMSVVSSNEDIINNDHHAADAKARVVREGVNPNPGPGTVVRYDYFVSFSPCNNHFALVVTAILLVIGCVETHPGPPEDVLPPGGLVAGDVIPRRSRRRVIITPNMVTGEITSTGGRTLSDHEIDILDRVIGVYDRASFWLNVTHFAITHDGSGKIEVGASVELKKVSGSVERVSWAELGSRMEKSLPKDRFTWRRFLRTYADSLVDIYLQADAFMTSRTGEEPLFDCCGLPPTDAVYLFSWASDIIPESLRRAVSEVNSTRTINSESKYVGDVNTRRRVERVKHNEAPQTDVIHESLRDSS